MIEQVFLDTNILIYSVGRDPDEEEKRVIARDLIDGGNVSLSVQVFQEFIHQITRPSRKLPLSAEAAWQYVASWRRFSVQETTLDMFDTAQDVQRRTHYSIWDSLIIAAAQAQGCKILYTEDMQHGRAIDDLRIINPFRQGASVR